MEEKQKYNDAKQVILVRKDLDMPPGKLGAQVAHASVACILNMGQWLSLNASGPLPDFVLSPATEAVHEWMSESFPKIVLQVKDEAQLLKFYERAKEAGLPTSLITDSGRTVFDQPTTTCVGIGPASREDIDAVTKKLRLYQ